MKILAISGSLRRDSYNTGLLRAAAELAPAGVDVELYPSNRLAAIPPYDGDVQELRTPEAVTELKGAIAFADAVLVATPEYNSSIPGQLKNAFDWVSRPLAESPLRGKPTMVIGASASAYGAIWAQADLRKVLGTLGGRIVEAEVAVAHAGERFDELGRLTDEETREQLTQAVGDLVGATAPAVLAA
jgi:chromate reductase, NAD(P)H dehydrogenase (quinone)